MNLFKAKNLIKNPGACVYIRPAFCRPGHKCCGHYVATVDYVMSTTLVFNVTISAGSTSSSFSIDINNDVDNETFNIAIRLLLSCLSLSLGTSSSTVMIIDNDGINGNKCSSMVFIIIIL